MLSRLLLLSLFLSSTLCHAVNIGCSEGKKTEIHNFEKLVEKARVCDIDTDCTNHKFPILGNGCQTFDSAINKKNLNFLIKESKKLPYCSDGIAECLIFMLEIDKTICENQLCSVIYKKYNLINND